MNEPKQRTLEQASDVIKAHLDGAVQAIDGQFGDGFAKANPQLVAELVRACSLENLAVCVAEAGSHFAQRF